MNREKDWIDDIVETALRCFNNRRIILWGKYIVSDEIKKRLEHYNITDVFFVDEDENKQDGCEVFSTQIIDGKSDSCYIIVPVGVYDSIRKKLYRGGYKNTDFYYFSDCIVKETEQYYEDAHGNKIIGSRKGLKIVFSGWNSEIRIGKNVSIKDFHLYIHNDIHVQIGNGIKGQFKSIHMENHSKMEIGDEVFIGGTQIEIGTYSALKIGNHSILGKMGTVQRVVIRNNAEVVIGDDFSIAGDFFFMISPNTRLKIGKDNMFSWGVRIFTDDGHSIFDVVSREAINVMQGQCREVVIGDHVWIGLRTTIFYGTNIGNGSIVGACSFMKGSFPNNCMIAGVPAKMIKKDVCWSRIGGTTDIHDCGEEYINNTIMLNI